MARISELFLGSVELFVSKFVFNIDNGTSDPKKKLSLNSEFIKNVVEVWARVGNRISQIYCGTESVATHMTKK